MLLSLGGLFINSNNEGLKPSLPFHQSHCTVTQPLHSVITPQHLTTRKWGWSPAVLHTDTHCNAILAESSNRDSSGFVEKPASFLPKSKEKKQQVQIRSVFLLCRGKMLQPSPPAVTGWCQQKSKRNPLLRAQFWIKMQKRGAHWLLATSGKLSKRASERARKSDRHSAPVLAGYIGQAYAQLSSLWVHHMAFGIFISFFSPLPIYPTYYSWQVNQPMFEQVKETACGTTAENQILLYYVKANHVCGSEVVLKHLMTPRSEKSGFVIKLMPRWVQPP